MGIGPRTAAIVALMLVICAPAMAEEVPEPATYRTQDYLAATPQTLAGARVVTTSEAHAIWMNGGAVFVDVSPKAERPAGLPKDTLWIDPSLDTIDGAHWVPNIGYGVLSKRRAGYFRRSLDHLIDRDRNRPVVFLCRRDCWMSWNAARRAVLEHRLTNVIWYPDGTDGWTEAGHPVVSVSSFTIPGDE